MNLMKQIVFNRNVHIELRHQLYDMVGYRF